jgi:2-keto-4-pentenoate hydratase/2-oxohepta-3-ene-1,7-dioic acid hydratase in catechol pathway
MPLCRFTSPGAGPAYALYRVHEGVPQFCPLADLTDDVPGDGEWFERGPSWLRSLPEPAHDHWRTAPDTLLPPVPNPQKVICIGLNYRDHAIETGAEIPTEPVVFSKFASTIVGHGDPIILPRVAEQVDYEAELVVVIGREGKHIDTADALDHVFGYTCGHDVSARDWQKGRPGGQWLLGKTFDSFAPIGPCLVTTAEITDPSDLSVKMRLNGEVVQESRTSQLIFDIPLLIAHLSQVVTLLPGDLIFTGTPPGVGAARNPPRFLKAGDRCEVEIERIGVLANQCKPEA